MRLTHDQLRLHIAKKILATLGTGMDLEQIYDFLVLPPQKGMGDLAFGCFIPAKTLKKAPPQVAQDLAAKLSADEVIEKAQAAGPYLNFYIRPEGLGRFVLDPILSEAFFKQNLTQSNPKTMIEYSQPNTHKELHVGHMRNACLGNSLVRILRYAGTEVIASTFPGDVGTHVAKCLWYLKYHNQDPIPPTGKGEWLGKLYSKAHLKLEDEEKTDKYETNKNQLAAILKQLEAKSGEYYDLWKTTREWSLELMQEAYRWCDIQFDQWYWESEVDSPSVQYVKGLFQKGLLIESQGAVGMDLEPEGLGFCMLLKSDGNGLYATKDLELARRKFQDFKIEKSIYVVDLRQALHFKQVFKVLEKLGFSQAAQCFHLQYNFVELPDGAMSSRKGNIVPLMQLVHRMEAMVKEKYLSRYETEWSKDEINLVATQVAQGAIKYGMVKIDNNKKIVFDMEEWLKIDGDSGPFIQYSAARIRSLVRKIGEAPNSADWSQLKHSSEQQLMQALMQFHTVVVQAAEAYRPNVICTYLFDLAQRFNLFYHEVSIGQAESHDLKQARLALSVCTGKILEKGLGLLGIPTPNRM